MLGHRTPLLEAQKPRLNADAMNPGQAPATNAEEDFSVAPLIEPRDSLACTTKVSEDRVGIRTVARIHAREVGHTNDAHVITDSQLPTGGIHEFWYA